MNKNGLYWYGEFVVELVRDGVPADAVAELAVKLRSIAMALHRLDEALCNDFDKAAKKEERLLKKAAELVEKYGLAVKRGSGDPRGAPLYLMTADLTQIIVPY